MFKYLKRIRIYIIGIYNIANTGIQNTHITSLVSINSDSHYSTDGELKIHVYDNEPKLIFEKPQLEHVLIL